MFQKNWNIQEIQNMKILIFWGLENLGWVNFKIFILQPWLFHRKFLKVCFHTSSILDSTDVWSVGLKSPTGAYMIATSIWPLKMIRNIGCQSETVNVIWNLPQMVKLKGSNFKMWQFAPVLILVNTLFLQAHLLGNSNWQISKVACTLL